MFHEPVPIILHTLLRVKKSILSHTFDLPPYRKKLSPVHVIYGTSSPLGQLPNKMNVLCNVTVTDIIAYATTP